jgi:putative nucleotidyltransferase with HDIG domain
LQVPIEKQDGARVKVENETAERLPWASLRLPPFPQVALRVLQLARTEKIALHELCELISTDPVFASEVLTVANSVLYAPCYPTNSILRAITILGENTLTGICIMVGARTYMGKAMSQAAMRNVWRHSLACAFIAERLAGLGIVKKDVAYTAGILHDVGRIALAVLQPQAYADLLDHHHGPAGSILEVERELFGVDHGEMGLRLISDWNLQEEFAPAVCEHHAPRRTDGAWNAGELIKVSCRMADAAGFPAFAHCEAAPYEELLHELPARERRLFYPDVAGLAVEIAQCVEAIEAV